MSASRGHPLAVFVAVAFAVGGCDDPLPPPGPGSIRVVVTPAGQDIFTSELQVTVENGTSRQYSLAGTLDLTITGVAPGTHTIRVHGMAVNCEVTGQNPRSVTVVSEQVVIATFGLLCVARVGSVRVATATVGADIDPDGYTAIVIGGLSQAIAVNGSATIAGVREGPHQVTLGGVSPNCAITGPDTVSVAVTLGATSDAAFSLECVPSGALTVAVSTTGVDLDVDGYRLTLQAPSVNFNGHVDIAANASGMFPRLRPAADYRVTLHDLAVNCEVVGPGAQTVAVTAGATANVTFAVACGAAPLLAIVRDGDIHTTTAGGTAATRLTTDPAPDGEPAWSITGRIAFISFRHSNDGELYVMSEDGTNQMRLTTSAGDDDSPSWSPDGQKIAFRSFRNVNSEIYIVNVDGSGLLRLTNNAADDFQPAWSSTGRIAFVSDRDHPSGEIYVMDADGSNVIRLTNNDLAEVSPAWSPDGSMIAFSREVECYYGCVYDIFVMNADGSESRRLPTAWASYQHHTDPAWVPNGSAVAFTRQDCGYYGCSTASVWLVDLHGPDLQLIAENAADPAWKP